MANFLDTFTRLGLVTASASDSGHTWTGGGSINPSNATTPDMVGGLLTTTAGAGTHRWAGQPSWAPSADHSFSARLINVVGNSNFYILGVRALNVASPTGYIFQVDSCDVGAAQVGISVYAVVAGSYTFDLNGVGTQIYSVASAANVLVEARVVGSTLSLWLDGVSAWSTTNTQIASGGTGYLALHPSPTADGSIDQVVGVDIGSGGANFWTNFARSTEYDS